jgi:hypothetical protein
MTDFDFHTDDSNPMIPRLVLDCATDAVDHFGRKERYYRFESTRCCMSSLLFVPGTALLKAWSRWDCILGIRGNRTQKFRQRWILVPRLGPDPDISPMILVNP